MPLPPTGISAPHISREAESNIKALINASVDRLIAGHPKLPMAGSPLPTSGSRYRPFHTTLVPSIARISRIERSFSTSLGTLLEEIAKEIAVGCGLESETQHVVSGGISSTASSYINDLSQEGRAAGGRMGAPDIVNETNTIITLNSSGKVAETDIIDVYVTDGTEEYYFDLKTPQPNSGQIPIMKKKLLRAKAMRLPKQVHGFAVFYYNPNGPTARFRTGQRYFDYDRGEVLVGKAFWDFLGGIGTYEELLELFADVGSARSAELASII